RGHHRHNRYRRRWGCPPQDPQSEERARLRGCERRRREDQGSRIVIRFSLICEREHEFEVWFSSNDDFETQKKCGFVDCPTCGSRKVETGRASRRERG